MHPSAKPLIGIDLMGGDNPPHLLLQGILKSLEYSPIPVSFVLFCDQAHATQVQALSDAYALNHLTSFQLVISKEHITLQDPPLYAFKSKRESSLWMGITYLKEKKIDAFISVGNTGALLAIAHFSLDLLPNINRPALLTRLPTMKNCVTLMDVGANTVATKDHLLQYAIMGSAYLRALGKSNFSAGLLNIGTEEHKGTVERKEAFALIKELHLTTPEVLPHFFGNIEPQDVFSGLCDLVITDGFSGNIFLKSAEGTSQLILNTIKKQAHHIISENQVTSLIQGLRPFFEHEVNPGALLTGVDGIIIKCHSYFDGKAIYHAISHAIELIQGNFIDKIKKNLA